MKHIKAFENFENENSPKPIPITTNNFLTNYYSCDDCNALWKEFNNEVEECKFCGSDEIEELQEDEWYEIAKARLKDDEIEDFENERELNKDLVSDLYNLKPTKNRNNYVN